MNLLTRDDFRESALKRDNYWCVICHNTDGLSVHHIIERKLWADGGYYLDNGASLCGRCHLEAEKTLLSCEQVRDAAKIKTVLLPPSFDSTKRYDKWGNIIHADGSRSKGPMFHNEGCLKVLTAAKLIFLFR
jgi:hypothetical protein